MDFIKKILGILTKKQKRELFLLQTLVVLVSFIELLGVASIAPFMAVAANPSVIQSNEILKWAYNAGEFTSETGFLKALGFSVLLFLLVGNILIFLTNWFLTSFGMNLGRAISVSLYKRYLEKDYLFHANANTAILTKNIFHEVVRVTNNIIVQFLLLNSKLFTILFIACGLIYVNPVLTILAGAVLGGTYTTVYLLTKKRLQENGAESSRLSGDAYRAVNEGLSGIRDVKLHGIENFYGHVFDKTMKKYSSLMIFNSVMPLAPRYALEVLTFGGVIVSFVFFISRGENINDFLPVLSIFAVAGVKLMPALQQVFASLTTMRSSVNSFHIISNDLHRLTDVDVEPVVAPISKTSFDGFSNLNVNGLTFKYPKSDEFAVQNVSFDIQRNTTNAFVGVSGSGKSTIVDLISGLLTPLSGAIAIDHVNLVNENIRNWQKQIGYVPQNIYLVDGSFKENIAFGESFETIDINKVREAAKLARLDEFIEQTPRGYDTRVGERGVQLSGGQRQRIGIARALYRNPAILIFDEATSALDNITEAEIMESIESLSKKKTIILIAHRLTTVKSCDQIFLMNKGKLEGSGTYQGLVESSKLFKDMIRDYNIN